MTWVGYEVETSRINRMFRIFLAVIFLTKLAYLHRPAFLLPK